MLWAREEPIFRLVVKRYVNRELSWIRFDQRVLDQVRKRRYETAERLRFLGISSANADEFFMVRVGSIYHYLDHNEDKIDPSGLNKREVLQAVLEAYQQLADEQQHLFKTVILPKLQQKGLRIVGYERLSVRDKRLCDKYFTSFLYPTLTPRTTQEDKAFPLLGHLRLIWALSVGTHETQRYAFVEMPKQLACFYEIPKAKETYFVPTEDIVKAHLSELFRNVKLRSEPTLFRITRNADFSLEDAEQIESRLLQVLHEKVKERRTGRVVRVEYRRSALSEALCRHLQKVWRLEGQNFFNVPSPLPMDHRALEQIAAHLPQPVQYKRLSAWSSPPSEPPLFVLLKQEDILVHHPYQSFSWVTKLLQEASEDAQVYAIKMTIYRLSPESQVVELLKSSARKGKHVSVIFEVKARFDEERNMQYARELQDAGCAVLYENGPVKVHAKLLLILRKEQDKMQGYVHIGTGNYNESTSHIYADIGLMTSQKDYIQDISNLFNHLTGYSFPKTYRTLIAPPQDTSQQLSKLVEQEVKSAKNGQPAGIVIKVNSLQDKRFIKMLYQTVEQGVPIRCIVRGVCCLLPTQNLSVRSIVGRHLEHARIFYFHQEGNPTIYVGSSDLMHRSFHRRKEALVKIRDTQAKKRLMFILNTQLQDNVNAYDMQPDGSYRPAQASPESPAIDAHKILYRPISQRKLEEIALF